MSTKWVPEKDFVSKRSTSKEIIEQLKYEAWNVYHRAQEYRTYIKEHPELSQAEVSILKKKISSYTSSYHSILDQLVACGAKTATKGTICIHRRNTSKFTQFNEFCAWQNSSSANISGKRNDDIAGTLFSDERDSAVFMEYDLPDVLVDDDVKLSQYRRFQRIMYTKMTHLQAVYVYYYFNKGLLMNEIAELFHINKSSVSRTIKRGLQNMKKFNEDARLAIKCDISPSVFDFVHFIYECKSMTRYQKLILLTRMSTAKPKMQTIANIFHVNKSTISRTLFRALDILMDLEVGDKVPAYRTVITIDRHTTQKSVEEELGL